MSLQRGKGMANELLVNNKEVLNKLTSLLQITNKPRTLMAALAATLHEETNDNFETEGHGSWPALKHRQGKPLQDTRRLYNSITERATNTSAELGTNVIYAALQHFGAAQGSFGKTKKGTPIPWGNVPARHYFPIDDNNKLTSSTIERLLEVIELSFQKALK